MASFLQRKPELAEDGSMKSMVIKIIGIVNTEREQEEGACFPTVQIDLTPVCEYGMRVFAKTTMRRIKNFAMARLTSLRYYQLSVVYGDRSLKDAATMRGVINHFPDFMKVRCLTLNIIMPDDMFIAMYNTFLGMGINEEKAVAQTKLFLDTYQNKYADYEYELAMRVEKCRIKLLDHGVALDKADFTLCE